jgi:hypothetical protein
MLDRDKVRDALAEHCPRMRYGEQPFVHGTIFHLPAATGSDYRFFLEAGSAPMVKAYRNRSNVGRVTESYCPGMKHHRDEIWSWPFDDDDYNEMGRDEYDAAVTKDFLEFVADISVYETCIVNKKNWLWVTSRCQTLIDQQWILLPRFSRKLTHRRPIPHSDCKDGFRSPPLACD